VFAFPSWSFAFCVHVLVRVVRPAVRGVLLALGALRARRSPRCCRRSRSA
jgi:hypothetical protein